MYSNNNPINHTDPSGHIPQWLNGVGDFFQGFSTEFVRTNNWIGAITSPNYAQSLAPSSSESTAMTVGRVVADIATIAVGVSEITAGGTIAGGGAVVGCGATLCLAAAPAIAVGAAIVSAGAMTTASGSIALGENLGKIAYNISNQIKDQWKLINLHISFRLILPIPPLQDSLGKVMENPVLTRVIG